MADKLTDAEVICKFMEPMPTWASVGGSRSDWLQRLHEVESQLTEGQIHQYIAWFSGPPVPLWYAWALIHASAEHKIAALAAVLRPAVEAQ